MSFIRKGESVDMEVIGEAGRAEASDAAGAGSPCLPSLMGWDEGF